MDKVKKRLKVLLRPGEYKRPEFAMAWRVPDVEPQQIVQETVELLRYHREIMNENWKNMDVEFARSDVYMDNLPEDVPFPNPNEETGKRSKGIGGLGSAALDSLVNSILNRDNQHPIRLVPYDGARIGEFVRGEVGS